MRFAEQLAHRGLVHSHGPTRGRAALARLSVAAALSLTWFALNAVVLAAGAQRSASISVAVLVADVLVVAWCARHVGVFLTIPLGVVSVVAFDWHAIPPTHDSVVPNVANAVALLAYLITGCLLGSLASEVSSRAIRSEAARARLADEHAALRRVATLVARQSSSEAVFDCVAHQAQTLLGVDSVTLLRYAGRESLVVLADARSGTELLPTGAVLPSAGDNVASLVRDTGRPASMEDYTHAKGPLAERLRAMGVRSSVACPVTVNGAVWGAMVAAVATPGRSLSADLQKQMSEFTDLVATSIANADSRIELQRSRARVVAQGDETRRRLERDLHDGVQQRLVSLALRLRMARELMTQNVASSDAAFSWVQDELTGVMEDLREISHGIHPAILSAGGLGPALATLGRRAALPVETSVTTMPELPEPVQVAAYYLVAEALTNTAKHARASRVSVEVSARERRSGGSVLRVCVDDDGVGGASVEDGSGLLGLRDRVEALGGRLSLVSELGAGTSLVAEIPVQAAS